MGQYISGQLVVTEGELVNTDGGTLTFMVNPTELTISKSNSWNHTYQKGRNVPKWEFKGGDPRQMQLELFFDSRLPTLDPDCTASSDLRPSLNKLFNFMMIDDGSQLKGAKSKMSHPPKCRMQWGEGTMHLSFDCYVTSCSIKYTMFDESGVPTRATASLTLLEATDSDALLLTNPTSRGDPGRRLWTVAEGDRLDWIAFREYGDASQWRRIAEANNLHNPLEVRPGMVLALPPR